jgi:predicted CXXCH cytochrome family protein
VPREAEPLKEAIRITRPGAPEPSPTAFATLGGQPKVMASAAAIELFEKTSCAVCHAVTRVPGPGRVGTPGRDLPQFKVAAVTAPHAWMPAARFDHKAHATATCTSCHDAGKSKDSTDVLMPTVESCRDCHAGSRSVAGKVTSDCGLCHGFHLPAHQTAPSPSQSATQAAAQPSAIGPRR